MSIGRTPVEDNTAIPTLKSSKWYLYLIEIERFKRKGKLKGTRGSKFFVLHGGEQRDTFKVEKETYAYVDY